MMTQVWELSLSDTGTIPRTMRDQGLRSVIFFTPGEVAADDYTGYLTNKTLTGLFAEAVGGATLLLEHRYWGESSPYDNLTAETLQYLTLKNSIADVVNVAKTIDLPFDTNHSSNAGSAPWIFSGGSYSGALSGWTEATSPGTFYAYHATSAVVETVWDFWQYFDPVQQGMAKNCSKDVSLVIDYIDSILLNGTAAEKLALKTKFGFQDLQHDDDFASNTTTNGTIPGEEGVGLETALAGYASWSKDILIPDYCSAYGFWTDEYDVGCFDSYNTSSPIYTDISVDNTFNRQWMWFLCNEPFGFWQDGAPTSRSSIVSRLVTAEYWSRQCALYFPTVNGFTYGYAEGQTVDDINAWTRGWDNTNTTHLIWTNGQYDPWKDATVSSDFRPGGPLTSTEERPVFIVEGGFHCSDLLVNNANANSAIAELMNEEVAVMKGWIDEYYATNSSSKAKRRFERTRQSTKFRY
ncbi:putative serine [Phaeomoniella chlamydospora]|uniref:Putative serine n=1 Tax=Phaeomoniella chlamydospora TaxID=158046 RepID=A0A0G2EYM0_PHACM|nr:putative serine [Phaeomoniella chlamydospora]